MAPAITVREASELTTATAALARSHGYSRMDCTTGGSDAHARAFHRGPGMAVADNLFYRIKGATLAAAAEGSWPARLPGGIP